MLFSEEFQRPGNWSMEREARGSGAIPLGKASRVAGLENCSSCKTKRGGTPGSQNTGQKGGSGSRHRSLWGYHGAKDQQVKNIKSRTGQWRLHALYTRSVRYETCRPTTCLWRRSGEEQGPASGAGIEPSSTLRKQHAG